MSEAAVSHDDLDEPSSADREAEVERLRVETNPSVVAKQEQAEKKARKALKALRDPKRCRSAYLELAVTSHSQTSGLTGEEFRVLFCLTTFAGADLTNCFPSLGLVALRLSKDLRALRKLVASLEQKGWIKRHLHRRRGSKLQTSSGIVFCIPAGELPGSADGWNGPENFDKRGVEGHGAGRDEMGVQN